MDHANSDGNSDDDDDDDTQIESIHENVQNQKRPQKPTEGNSNVNHSGRHVGHRLTRDDSTTHKTNKKHRVTRTADLREPVTELVVVYGVGHTL